MKRSKPLTLAAAVLSVGLVMSGCANQTDSDSGSDAGASGGGGVELPTVDQVDTPEGALRAAGEGGATCPEGTTIAYIGAETGPNAQLGVNIYNGVQTAIDEHNEANPECTVEFTRFDTEGDPTKATGPVTQAVNNQQIIGVVGLPFSGESKATGNIFEQAGLVHVTPAATNPTLTDNGWRTFFRGLGNDAVQGPAAAEMMTTQLEAENIYVVQDDSDYGIGLGTAVKEALGDSLTGEDRTITGNKDFSAIITKINSATPDAVFYSGYYAEAAPFIQQLRASGYDGAFVGPDGIKDPEFIKQSGDSSAGAYFTCPCIPGELIPEFADAYMETAGVEPGTYSIEGYDATTVLLAGIDAGNHDRAALLDWVVNYDAPGLSKYYRWNEKGELQEPDVYGYKAEGGKIVSVGKIGE